jgi:hypothetical protein
MKTLGGMCNNIFVVLQGPVDYVDDIIKTYMGYREIMIISTNHINETSIKKLRDNGFKLIINEKIDTPGTKNFNNQVLNTYNGIKVAKELNYDYVLKMRCDIMIPNLGDLLNNLDKGCVYFSAYHNWKGGYLCEHMVFGPTDYMLNLWNIPISTTTQGPEKQLTKHFNTIRTNEVVKYIFPLLYDNNIIANWVKYKKFLNDYKDDKLFTYEEY